MRDIECEIPHPIVLVLLFLFGAIVGGVSSYSYNAGQHANQAALCKKFDRDGDQVAFDKYCRKITEIKVKR